MPAQTLEHSSKALHSAEAIILTLRRYVVWYRRQAVDLPDLGLLFCDFRENRLDDLSRNPNKKLRSVSSTSSIELSIDKELTHLPLLFSRACQRHTFED